MVVKFPNKDPSICLEVGSRSDSLNLQNLVHIEVLSLPEKICAKVVTRRKKYGSFVFWMWVLFIGVGTGEMFELRNIKSTLHNNVKMEFLQSKGFVICDAKNNSILKWCGIQLFGK